MVDISSNVPLYVYYLSPGDKQVLQNIFILPKSSEVNQMKWKLGDSKILEECVQIANNKSPQEIKKQLVYVVSSISTLLQWLLRKILVILGRQVPTCMLILKFDTYKVLNSGLFYFQIKCKYDFFLKFEFLLDCCSIIASDVLIPSG